MVVAQRYHPGQRERRCVVREPAKRRHVGGRNLARNAAPIVLRHPERALRKAAEPEDQVRQASAVGEAVKEGGACIGARRPGDRVGQHDRGCKPGPVSKRTQGDRAAPVLRNHDDVAQLHRVEPAAEPGRVGLKGVLLRRDAR